MNPSGQDHLLLRTLSADFFLNLSNGNLCLALDLLSDVAFDGTRHVVHFAA